MKIASFNVNSLKVRLEAVCLWLKEHQPDVLFLQETKTIDENFPKTDIEELGYFVEYYGQKSYNGVALISKTKPETVIKGLPGFADEQARVIGATINDIHFYGLYCPNGNPVDSEKYPYKLAFMEALYHYVKDDLIDKEIPFLLAGDFNLCPDDVDCYDPEGFKNDALLLPKSREAYRKIMNLGLWDSWRTLNPLPKIGYSYWDYQKGRFQKGDGLRIDHILLSPLLVDHLKDAGIDKEPRARERPSDHTVIWCDLDI